VIVSTKLKLSFLLRVLDTCIFGTLTAFDVLSQCSIVVKNNKTLFWRKCN